MARCKTCQAEIVWMLTSAGKRVPLDPPEKRYVENLTSTHRGQVEVQDTWLSHFATCPQADQHRKKRESLFDSENLRGQEQDDG